MNNTKTTIESWSLTPAAQRRLGKRASAFVTESGYLSHRNRDILVADYQTPTGVERTLTRLYGRSTTVDRGELAYWHVPSSDFKREDV